MQSSQTGLQIWFRWLIASTAGIVLGYLLASSIMFAEQDSYSLVRAAVSGAAFGLCLASLQLLSVSPYMKMGHWIIASVLGYSLGMVFLQLGNDLLHFNTWAQEQERSLFYFAINATSISLVIGLPVGLMHWWNFRHRGVSLLGWVLASVAAIAVSIFASSLVAWIVNTDQTVSGSELLVILLPLTVIFSTVNWIPIFQLRETNMPQKEMTDTPLLEDTSRINS